MLSRGPESFLALFLVFFLAAVSLAAAQDRTIFVAPNGKNSLGCGLVQSNPCANVSYAIQQYAANKTKLVRFVLAPGRYLETPSTIRDTSIEISSSVPSSVTIECDQRNGPLLAFYRSTSTISGFLIQNCQDNDGGALQFVDSSGITMKNISINDAEAFRGGAILVSDSSRVVADSIRITNTKASFYGGALLVSDSSSFTVSNLYIATTHSASGGAVAVVGSRSSFVGTDVTADTTDTFNLKYGIGGFLHALNDSSVRIDRFTASRCTAGLGGAIAASNGGKISISNAKFTSNTALRSGGALWASGESSQISVSDAVMTENVAGAEGGGAIHASLGSSIKILSTKFASNKIARDTRAPGSGIFVTNTSSLYVFNSTFENHEQSDSFGAAIAVLGNYSTSLGPSVVIDACLFRKNKISGAYTNIPYHGGCAVGIVGATSFQVSKSRFDANKCDFGSVSGAFLSYQNLEGHLIDSSFTFNDAGSSIKAAAAHFYGGGQLTISNVSFANNSCGFSCSPSVYFELKPQNMTSANWNLAGLRVIDNSRGDFSAVTLVVGGDGSSVFSLSNSTFSNNPSGGLTVSSERNSAPGSSQVFIRDSIFANHSNGAASFYDIRSAVVVTGVTFVSNRAKSGAAIYVGTIYRPYSLSFDSCTFRNNSATESGGAVSFIRGAGQQYAADLAIRACSFYQNKASIYGGAIHVTTTFLNITGCTFVANTAMYGGAIASSSGAFPNVSSSIIDQNSAQFGGGLAVMATSSTWPPNQSDMTSIRLFSSKVTRNVASRSGGGIYISSVWGKKNARAPLEIRDTFFEGNMALGNGTGSIRSAADGGGAFACQGLWSSRFIKNIRFYNNSAPFSPWTHHVSAMSCGQLSPYNCEKCSASAADCLYSGDSYGGSCECASSGVDGKYCTPKEAPLTCFGISSTSKEVCSRVGSCIAPDQCLCPIERSGMTCGMIRIDLKVLPPSSSPNPNANCSGQLCPSIEAAVRLILNQTDMATTGFLISLSEGLFTVNRTVGLPPNTNVRGLGNGASIQFKKQDSAYAILGVSAPSIWSQYTIIDRLLLVDGGYGLELNSGYLLLRNSVIQNMVSGYGGSSGGGLGVRAGKLIIENCLFSKNAWIGTGAILAFGGDITIRNTEVANNFLGVTDRYPTGLGFAMRGGCADAYENCFQGQARIINSRFHHQRDGPAIGIDGGARLTIINTTIDNNLMGIYLGGGYSQSPTSPLLTVENSIITRNAGTGALLYASSVLIEKSTFSFNGNTAIHVTQCSSLTLRDLEITNNTSSGDGAAGLYLDGISRSVRITELRQLYIARNNGSTWGDAGGLGCLGPSVPSAGIIEDIVLEDNFTLNPRGSPNENAWNRCTAIPAPQACAACSSVESHCILSSQACVCQPGYSGKICNVKA